MKHLNIFGTGMRMRMFLWFACECLWNTNDFGSHSNVNVYGMRMILVRIGMRCNLKGCIGMRIGMRNIRLRIRITFAFVNHPSIITN